MTPINRPCALPVEKRNFSPKPWWTGFALSAAAHSAACIGVAAIQPTRQPAPADRPGIAYIPVEVLAPANPRETEPGAAEPGAAETTADALANTPPPDGEPKPEPRAEPKAEPNPQPEPVAGPELGPELELDPAARDATPAPGTHDAIITLPDLDLSQTQPPKAAQADQPSDHAQPSSAPDDAPDDAALLIDLNSWNRAASSPGGPPPQGVAGALRTLRCLQARTTQPADKSANADDPLAIACSGLPTTLGSLDAQTAWTMENTPLTAPGWTDFLLPDLRDQRRLQRIAEEGCANTVGENEVRLPRQDSYLQGALAAGSVITRRGSGPLCD